MDAIPVSTVAQLAVELVDEVAPVGEDQDSAGPRGLDEAERRHRLARAGRVLEPEPPVGIGIHWLLVELDVRVEPACGVLPVLRLLVLLLDVDVAVLELEVLLARDRRGRELRRLDRDRVAVDPAVAVALLL